MEYQQLEKKWGAPSDIARALNVSRQLVSHWQRNGITRFAQAYIQVKTRGRMRANLEGKR